VLEDFDPSHVIIPNTIQLKDNFTFDAMLVQIMDKQRNWEAYKLC